MRVQIHVLRLNNQVDKQEEKRWDTIRILKETA